MAHKVCPYWVGFLLLNPLRKIYHDPDKILRPYLKPGIKALDIGSAMGFFSLPMAKIIGKKGKVICVDIREKMLSKLKKRAKKVNLSDQIILHVCSQNSLNLEKYTGEIDFALASAVVHEIHDTAKFFSDLNKSLKQSAKLLIMEPEKRVSMENFTTSISHAEDNGFQILDRPKIKKSHSCLLIKK